MTVSRLGTTTGGRRSILDAGRRVPRAAGVSLARVKIGDDSRRLAGFTPVSFVAATQAIVGSASSLSITTPAGLTGDLLMLWAVTDDAMTFSVPSGYTEATALGGSGSVGSLVKVATRVTDGSEGATLVVTAAGNAGRFGGQLLRFRPGKSGPIDVGARTFALAQLNTTPSVAPSVDASVAGHLVCLFYRRDGGTFTSDPAGMTRRVFQNDQSITQPDETANMAMLTVSQALAAPGQTSTRTAQWSGFDFGDDMYSASIVLR